MPYPKNSKKLIPKKLFSSYSFILFRNLFNFGPRKSTPACAGRSFPPKSASFTLVELLVVVAIIGLLATIAMVALNEPRQRARNARRTTDLDALATALEMYFNDYGIYPYGALGGSIDSRDGFCLEKSTGFASSMASYISSIPNDPLYKNVDYPEYCYWYRIRNNGQQYKIFARIETTNYDPANKDAGIESNSYEVFSHDAYNLSRGYILVSKNSNNSYYFERTGSVIKDKTAFYVMDYEAKYDKSGDGIGDDAATYSCKDATYDIWNWSVSACRTGGTVVSTPEGSPIARITHTQAVASDGSACPSGFHLITNDEWMAIARDAEKVAANWSSGTVGTDCLWRGNTGTSNPCGSAAYDGDNPEKGTNRNSKAKFTLSNGSEIWDIAGNIWEHVQNRGTTGADTLISLQDNPEATTDGSNPVTDTGFNWSDLASGGGLSRYLLLTQSSYYGDLDNDGDSDDDDKKALRPSNDSYSAAYGMGRIYHYSNSSTVTDSYVFFRGGTWYSGAGAGAFTLYLSWTASNQSSTGGLRCAR